MRLKRRDRSPDRARQLGSELAAVAAAKRLHGRICGESCTMKCPQCGSTACHCECSPQCPEAPRALSVEPDKYPIEPAVLPLVYEMRRLGTFTPCWSCEGHLHPDGSPWKSPSVWFYCDSTVHVRLLSDGLKHWRFQKKLHARWQVAVAFSDPDNLETTFSLEPVADQASAVPLPKLQEDIATIAHSLDEMMTAGARALQREAATLSDSAG
jgi:hypothetical protein